MKRPKYQKWTIVYFCLNATPFLAFCFLHFQDGGFSPDEEMTARLIFASLFLLSTIPIWRITLGKNTPRNYRKLLSWISLEAIYNPVFGIPVWVSWVKNKAFYGNEAAFESEKQKRKIKTQRTITSLRKGATGLIVTAEALKVLEKATPEQMGTMVNVGLLALLNPDKTKKVKNVIANAIDPANSKTSQPTSQSKSAQDRIFELKKLYDNQLITLQEYEAKKAEIINQL